MKSLENLLDRNIFLMYKSGKSISSISKLYNCSRQTITRYLKKYDRFIPEKKPRQKKNIDINQLGKITKEMAYILGLIWTDGYLSSKNNSYTIGVKLLKTDIDELKLVFDKIGNYSYNNLKVKNRRETSSISFFSKEFYNFLFNLDFKNKSKESPDKLLLIIPDRFKPYFFRGIIDGDGYIGVKIGKGYQLSVSGTYDQNWNYLEKLFKKFEIKYSIERRISKKTNSISSCIVTYNYRDILKFLNYLYKGYKNDKIGLTRKYEKYLQIIELAKKKKQ